MTSVSRTPIPHSPFPEVLCLLAIGLTSCGVFRAALNFENPDVQVSEIRVTGLGLTGGTLDLVLDVYNPNTYDIHGTRLGLGVDLEDTHFGDAEITTPFALSATRHNQVIVPVRFEWAGVGAGAQALLTKQAIRFAANGTVGLDTPIGARDLQIHAHGDVPLTRLRP